MEWRDIPGYRGYKVNESGEIKGPSGQMVRLRESANGYLEFTARYNVKVHRAVLLAFEGVPVEGKNIARHLDGDRKNNIKDNLKWGSYSENTRDAINHGTHVSSKQRGEVSTQSKLTEQDVITIRRRSHVESIVEIHKDYPQVHKTTVRKIARGLKWKHVDSAPPSKVKYLKK